MLGRWFERSGIGQFVAPDERLAKEPIPEEGNSSIWQFLAPDPEFASKFETKAKVPPSAAFPPPPSISNEYGSSVRCIHCNKFTPFPGNHGPPDSSTPSTLTNTPTKSGNGVVPRTPSAPTSSSRPEFPHLTEVDMLVLSAAKDTTASFNSPPDARDIANKALRFCASAKALNPAMQGKLRKLLKKHPVAMKTRATGLGDLAPDGYTPLMATAHADHVVAANILFELSSPEEVKDMLFETDLQGRTAMHIASEKGHINMVNLLHQKMAVFDSPPPIDLLGRTPLGRAVTSPNPAARKNQKALVDMLYKPGDISVCGNPRPGGDRTGISKSLLLAYGTADMPGFRVRMEDALCSQMWIRDRQPYCLLGVFDGHGDRGMVSQYAADHVISILQSNMLQHSGDIADEDWNAIFTRTLLTLDDKIKEKALSGGSTAVLALITVDSIIVANVGDSRCILVQSRSNDWSGEVDHLSKNLGELTVSPRAQDHGPQVDEGYPPAIDQDQPQQATPTTTGPLASSATSQDGPVVLALSEDQKPNLDCEKARIEKSGMKVIPIKFEEDGEEIIIYKVERSKEEQLAVSRALGDFEYKGNEQLGPEEQAVVALPEVRVHHRNHSIDSYLVLACDGIWDVMSNEDVAEFIQHQVSLRASKSESVLTEVADALLNECLGRGSKDNMSVTIVALSQCMEQMSVSSTAMEGKTLDFRSPRKK